ncbi:MAG: AmmeMemoRadiSam system protein A [Ignavibacteriales bacterium CG_4_9_14_3_um_filter_30_11]|nr:MAG: AmmeMemoRadiSam system protein A [Ignavibacteriales bacterium CG_4_9_14_3_um_filter_30_11]
MNITKEVQGLILLVARETLISLFSEDAHFTDIDYKMYPQVAMRNTGAFVTLKQNGNLRGCIGYLSSPDMLIDTIKDATIQAATNDPRFNPITFEELSKIYIEVSVLSPPVQLRDYKDIRIGEHGLLLEEPNHRGVLLPQVATEHNFNIQQFLTALCEKAGMHPYTWEDTPLNIKVFTAAVMSEVGKRKKTYDSA